MSISSDFGATMRPSRRELILVVAEEPTRGSLVTRLQEDGYSVISTTNADEARAMLSLSHAAAVVTTIRGLHVDIPMIVATPGDVDTIADTVAAAVDRGLAGGGTRRVDRG